MVEGGGTINRFAVCTCMYMHMHVRAQWVEKTACLRLDPEWTHYVTSVLIKRVNAAVLFVHLSVR